MASALQQLVPGQFVPNTETTLYTSPTGTTTRIDKVTVTNTDAVAHTITIHLVPAGGTAGGSNCSTQAQSILPGKTWNSPNEYGQTLRAGDFFSAIADSAGYLALFVAGTQVTN
ncbi:MAG TPA: hypothetical protein VMV33_17095 [Rhodocyclaceae bacterium]|nr:hypothetical protein [Rhodocyclaceae bacterium]